MNQDILNDIAVYPPKEAVRKGEHLKDIGQAVQYFDNYWTEIKSNK
jgi:spermidine/putrescine transport system permease protein